MCGAGCHRCASSSSSASAIGRSSASPKGEVASTIASYFSKRENYRTPAEFFGERCGLCEDRSFSAIACLIASAPPPTASAMSSPSTPPLAPPSNDSDLVIGSETLMFAAQLRLPASMSIEDKQRHVDTVIAKLGLTPARDTIIGNAKVRGVSASA